jgi:hypothetical protein
MRPAVITAARAEASREGWRAGFDGALAAAGGAIDRLDRGLPVDLPVPLSLRGTEHAHHWYRMEPTNSVDREAALRVPLAAERREVVTR